MKLFFLGMLLTLSLSCQSQKCLNVEILISKPGFNTDEKKEIVFRVKNKTQETISLPEGLREGRQDDEEAEFYLEVLKRESNDAYIKAENSNNDYQYLIGNRKFYSLRPNEVITYHTDMELLHNLKSKGYYKVRIVLRSGKFLSCKYSESSWEEFEVR